MENAKQIIVARRNLMSPGKLAAQVSHGSISFLTKYARFISDDECENYVECGMFSNEFVKEICCWLKNSFTKIILGVNSEEELDEVCNKARAAGLEVHLIIDNGRTEFNNVSTKTCVAIGPHYEEKFIGITDHLKLY